MMSLSIRLEQNVNSRNKLIISYFICIITNIYVSNFQINGVKWLAKHSKYNRCLSSKSHLNVSLIWTINWSFWAIRLAGRLCSSTPRETAVWVLWFGSRGELLLILLMRNCLKMVLVATISTEISAVACNIRHRMKTCLLFFFPLVVDADRLPGECANWNRKHSICSAQF